MRLTVSVLVVFILIFVLTCYAQVPISKIEVIGNTSVSTATVLSKIKTRSGQVYNDNLINEDIKNLYSTGFFENIEVKKRTAQDGVVVVFKVEEKPIIKKISIEGAKRISPKRIEKLIDIKEGAFLDEYALKEIEDKIEDLYRQKGFSNAAVSSDVTMNKEREVTVAFLIDERFVVRVRKIVIKGNESLDETRLRKLMRTKERGWHWLWFRRGIFKEEMLDDDIKRIEDFYKEKGFGEITVEPALDYIKNDIYITISLNEGPRYYIGRVKIEGNKELSLDELNKTLMIKPGDVYVERQVNAQAGILKGAYIDKGYIFSEIKPIIFFNPQTKKIDVSYSIQENQVAYVEKIDIRGNIKTKDKVIRRELRIYPGDRFEGGKIRKSKQRLDNLGFFEEVRFDSEAGSKPNWENLVVDVKEAKTGYLSFGGGFSTIDQVTGFVEIRQRNFDYKNWETFTGAGQDLSIMASIGSLTDRYELHFTNPWIFDTPYSFSFEGYRRGHSREENVGYAYEEDVYGGALKLGKEFSDTFKGWLGYRYESVKISDVASDASSALKAEAGTTDLTSIELDLIYDGRDNVFSPTKGIYFSNSIDTTLSGLGGNRDFVRLYSQFRSYFPLPRNAVLEYSMKAGVADPFSDTTSVPLYRRFFAGGASTIRGYRERKVGPIDSSTQDPVGGEALFVANIEYTYPVVDILKMALFFDTGNVWSKKSDFFKDKLYSGVGLGVRVKTPLGPINLDYGWPLNLEPGEEKKQGRFHFSISRGF